MFLRPNSRSLLLRGTNQWDSGCVCHGPVTIRPSGTVSVNSTKVLKIQYSSLSGTGYSFPGEHPLSPTGTTINERKLGALDPTKGGDCLLCAFKQWRESGGSRLLRWACQDRPSRSPAQSSA